MSQKSTGKAGVVTAPGDANSMDKLATAVLDDLLYNVVHDLLMKTHRDEKQARAATAAIRVETLAAEAAQDLAGATGESKAGGGHYDTDAASYDNGSVSLKGNPLKTTHDIVCPRCRLPRLLYPTDGRGARKPDPAVTYCKKHPYIDKPGCDIYGQMWVAPGPGRGKKKKDFDKKVSAAIHAATTGIETPNGTGGVSISEQRPPNVLSFPSATCSKCKRCILVSRLNNHMGSCIGNSGRNASRAAAQKISNGSSTGGTHDHTPPNSQKGTPLPSSQAASPRKRDADDFDEAGDDESDTGAGRGSSHGIHSGHNSHSTSGNGNGHSHAHNLSKPKKKLKSSATNGTATPNGTGTGTGTPSSSQSSQGLSGTLSKKLTLKMKSGSSSSNGNSGNSGNSSNTGGSSGGLLKKKKIKTNSLLSFERKLSAADRDDYAMDDDDGDDYEAGGAGDRDDDDDEDDDDDARSSINFKAATSASVSASTVTSAPAAHLHKKKKQIAVATGSGSSSTPPKKTTKVPIPIPGIKKVKLVNKPPLSPPASKNGRARDIDAESESSGTMSSPRT